MQAETAPSRAGEPDIGHRDPRRLSRNRTTVWLLGGLGLALAVLIPLATVVALGDYPYERLLRSFPGLPTAMVTTALTVGAELSALLTVGAMIYCLFLREATPREMTIVDQTVEIVVLRVASASWAAFAGLLTIFTAFDAGGQSIERIVEPRALPFLWEAADAPRAWTLTFFAALIVFFAASFTWRWTGLLIPFWAAAFGVLAPVVVGHVLVGPSHDLGGDAAIFQVLAVTALFGVFAVALARVASGRFLAVETVRRIAWLGAVSLPIIVATDIVIALFKLSGTSILGSLTGWFIIARWMALVIVVAGAVWFGALRRRGRLRERHIVRLLTVGGMAIAAWVGLTVAMTRVPPPQYFVPTSIQEVFLGFTVADAPAFAVLFTQWRLNLLFAGIAVAAVAVYLIAVRVLHRRGDHWPRGRTAAWLIGWALVVLATSSGFGKYSGPDFGVHMVVHMTLNMLAPAILALGGVLTLLLRSTSGKKQFAGAHEWITGIMHWSVLRVVLHPLLVFVVFVGSYYALYLTGAFENLMPFHWAHQLMNLHFLIVGYLFYSLVIGVDRPPQVLPHVGKLGYVLAAMPFHAFFGVILMQAGSSSLIAQDFYLRLDLPWLDLPAAQQVAAGVAWAGGEIPLMIVVVVLGIQWAQHDARDATRKDRHLDRGLDTDFDDYNEMLARLGRRQNPAEGASIGAGRIVDRGHTDGS